MRDSRAKSAFLHITATSRLSRVLRNDKRAFFTTAARAAAFLHGLQAKAATAAEHDANDYGIAT